MWQAMVPILLCAFVGGVGLAFLLLPPMEDIRPPFLDEKTTVARAELDWRRRRLRLWAESGLVKSYRIALSPSTAEEWHRVAVPLRLWRMSEHEGTGFWARGDAADAETPRLRFLGLPRPMGWRIFRDPAGSLPAASIALNEAEVRELRRVIADGTPLLMVESRAEPEKRRSRRTFF